MMVGIHIRPGSYSDRWTPYCEERHIPYRRIDCLATDVIQQCEGLDALLWHWSHENPADKLVARQVIASIEAKGIAVFPNTKTCWHYDDKIGQKYLLEAIDAPFIPTWIFTDRKEALSWIEHADWPKVFKLRSGAGSRNVRLVHSRQQAVSLCKRAFNRGFPAVSGFLVDMPTKMRKIKAASDALTKISRVPGVLFNNMTLRRKLAREKGYIYFQAYLPNNSYDTRITVIGDRAFGFTRMNRRNDFRASGSGTIKYDEALIDHRCVSIAFKITNIIGAQSLAFDFLFDSNNNPMISEISYCYMPSAVTACRGYWDSLGEWHLGHVCPEDAIIDDLLMERNRIRLR